jgi:hypothetical protein
LGGALRTGALAPGYAAELSLGVLVSSTGVSHQSPRRLVSKSKIDHLQIEESISYVRFRAIRRRLTPGS